MKENVSKAVAKVIGVMEQEQIKELLETPPDSSMGDMALPCFAFAKIMHKNPAAIAMEIKSWDTTGMKTLYTFPMAS